jgi:hypothetical protein
MQLAAYHPSGVWNSETAPIFSENSCTAGVTRILIDISVSIFGEPHTASHMTPGRSKFNNDYDKRNKFHYTPAVSNDNIKTDTRTYQ